MFVRWSIIAVFYVFLNNYRLEISKSKANQPQDGPLLLVIWLVLSDEQMSKEWPFSLLNDKQTDRNWLGVEHRPVINGVISRINGLMNR